MKLYLINNNIIFMADKLKLPFEERIQNLREKWNKLKLNPWVLHWISEDPKTEQELLKLKAEISELAKEVKKSSNQAIKEQILALRHEIIWNISPEDRHIFLEDIMAWKAEKNLVKNLKWKSKDAVSDVLKKWSRNISVGDIYMMKKEWVDLSQMFLLSEDWKQVSKDEMSSWDIFTVNFWKNASINYTIGAWDLLPLNRFSRVKITWKKDWKGGEFECVRGYIPRPWYYIPDSQGKPTWDYIRIYDGYTIEILEEKWFEKTEEEDFKKAESNRYEIIRQGDFKTLIREAGNTKEIEIPYKGEADLTLLKNFIDKTFGGKIEIDGNKLKTKDNQTFSKIFQESFWFDRTYNGNYTGRWGPFVSMTDAQADNEKWRNSYWCAYIARMNAKEQFWLDLVSGDADVAMNSYKGTEPWVMKISTTLDFLKTEWIDFADLYYTGKSWLWKKLEQRWGAGHRVVGYKWWWEWFVLDAYANSGKPIPLVNYASDTWRTFVKGVLFDSPVISEIQAKEAEIVTRTKLEKTAQFMEKLTNVCNNIWCSVEDMLTVMDAESWISTSIENPLSWAIWLIQFTKRTAKGLGTSVEELAKMSWVEQLDYVEKYYKPYRWRFNRVEDLYLATFHPASLGKSEDSRIWVEIGQWKDNNPDYKAIYEQNPAIRDFAWGKWYITVGDFYAYVRAKKLHTI